MLRRFGELTRQEERGAWHDASDVSFRRSCRKYRGTRIPGRRKPRKCAVLALQAMRLVSTSAAALLNCFLGRVRMSPRGRARQAFACRGNVQKHGCGFRVRFWCGEIEKNIRGPPRESTKKALADLQYLRQRSTAGDLVAKTKKEHHCLESCLQHESVCTVTH